MCSLWCARAGAWQIIQERPGDPTAFLGPQQVLCFAFLCHYETTRLPSAQSVGIKGRLPRSAATTDAFPLPCRMHEHLPYALQTTPIPLRVKRDRNDNGLPICSLLTSTSVRDCQVGISLMNLTSKNVTYCYVFMYGANDAGKIWEINRALGHVPIIDRPSWRQSDADGIP